MSFHGGLLGVTVAAVWFARRRRVPVLHLADALALATPFGIFFVRLAKVWRRASASVDATGLK